MMSVCLEEPECKGVTLNSNKKWSLRQASTGKLEPSPGEGPSYIKKISGIDIPDEAKGASLLVSEREEEPDAPTQKTVMIKKKKPVEDYSGVAEQFAGPVENHILKKQITKSESGNSKSGKDKLKMMSVCLEEPECKGVTLNSNKKWSLRQASTGKLEPSPGEGPSYIKKISGIDIPDSSTAATAVTDANNSNSTSTKTKPKDARHSVKSLSEEDIDRMSLDELKSQYNIEKNYFIKGSDKIKRKFNFKSNKENNFEFERALRECLKEEICTGVTEKPYFKKKKYEMRDGIELLESNGENTFVKHTKKTGMFKKSLLKSKKLELGK